VAQAVNDQVDYGRDVRRNADLPDILIVSVILAQALKQPAPRMIDIHEAILSTDRDVAGGLLD
jgi:hypothetical protein